MIEAVWTPSKVGDPEPYLKAYGVDDRTIRPFYAYHRDEVGRRYYQIPDSEKNRELVRTRGPGWQLVNAQPLLSPDIKREQVCEILTGLGIQHRSNMKFETLVQKLPVGMRGGFL